MVFLLSSFFFPNKDISWFPETHIFTGCCCSPIQELKSCVSFCVVAQFDQSPQCIKTSPSGNFPSSRWRLWVSETTIMRILTAPGASFGPTTRGTFSSQEIRCTGITGRVPFADLFPMRLLYIYMPLRNFAVTNGARTRKYKMRKLPQWMKSVLACNYCDRIFLFQSFFRAGS